MLTAVAVTIDSIMKPVFGVPTGTGVGPTGGMATPRLGVRGIPAMYLFRGGSILAQAAGAMSTDAIVRWVHNHLGS
jgi:hypothetical protein